jgi:uncharacterized membrane protein
VAAPADPPAAGSAPWWLAGVTLPLALLGLGVSAYLTAAHYNQHVQLFCSDQGLINCASVTTSPESRFLGLPVALLGLIYFLTLPALLLPAAWRSPSRVLRTARLGAVAGGLLFVLWLVYAELFRIGRICLYCTAVHLIVFALFAVVSIGTALTGPEMVDPRGTPSR